MEIKVISLNREAKKLHKIKFNFFDAIDNINIKSKLSFRPDLFKLIYGRDAKNGEIGCSLSHIEVISNFYYENKSEHLIILEDDAMIEDDFSMVVDCISKRIEVAEIFILGMSKTKKENLWIHKIKFPLSKKIDIGKNKFGYSDVNFFGTVGYIVNKKAAEIISKQKDIFWLADDWSIISNMGINIYIPREPVVYEDLTTNSSIGNEICCYNSLKDNFKNNFKLIIKGIIKRIV